MASCALCGKDFSFFENLTNRSIGRCKACDQHQKQIQQHMLNTLEQTFWHIGISPQVEQGILRQIHEVRMPSDLSAPVLQRSRYLKMLTDIRNGNVPQINTSIHLDSDEYAHFEMRVVYFKPNKKIKQIPGRLIGTNKKCYFISDSGSDSATIDWNNVSQVYEENLRVPQTIKRNGNTYTTYQDFRTLHISVTKGAGGGGYQVSDSLYTKTLIDTLVRLWKRQLVLYKEQATQGAIPEHVKAAVFQRDGGRCVQCGNEGPYIEYDHKIPRSKGGPNTIENIQLLCRMCNLRKGDRL